MTSSVRVVYDYHYSTVEGHPVHIHIGDQFQLLNKTSRSWWHVRRDSGQVPFYVPADCVEEVYSHMKSPRRSVSKSDSSLDRMRTSSAYDEPSADYSSDISDEERGVEADSSCFDNPVYALPNVPLGESLDSSRGSSEDEKVLPSAYPEYVNMRHALNSAPPLPAAQEVPVRVLEDWEEFEDSLGRRYYFHPRTNTSSWKPPRRLMHFYAEALYAQPDSSTSDLLFKAKSPSSMEASLRSPEDPSRSKDHNETNTGLSFSTTAVVEMESKVTAIIYGDLPPSPSPLLNSVVHGRHVNFMPRFNRSSSMMEDVHNEDSNGVVSLRDLDNEKENTDNEKLKSASLPMPKRSPPSKDFNELRQLIANKISCPDRSVRARSVLLLNEVHMLEFDKIAPKTGVIKNSKTLPTFLLGKTWKSERGVLQGFLNVTKFSESGRRLKKQWMPAFVVLMDSTLFVFKSSQQNEYLKTAEKLVPAGAVSRIMLKMFLRAWGPSPLRELGGAATYLGNLQHSGVWCTKVWTKTSSGPLSIKHQKGTPPFALEQSPEMFIDLPGSTIKWSQEKSHRKNVFEISAADGSQVLIQDDNKATSQDWVNCIVQTLARLPLNDELSPIKVLPVDPCKPERPLSPRIARLLVRTRSAKGRPDGQLPSPLDSPPSSAIFTHRKKKSVDEMETSDIKVKKLKIIERLKNFFSRRPTLESLKAKGIIRDGPVFGCNFLKLCEHEQNNVPNFIKRCIAAIEKKDIRTDGIYRVSGNLSQVQKIRFQIDQDKYTGMEAEEDVNVLTGLLKLFFRELKEPMIPFNLYEPLMKANKMTDKSVRERKFKELVNQIPGPNATTLGYLFQHLHRIAHHGEHNRMPLLNLAIVFGPTLMWPETPSMNLATDMLCQNQVVEHLLLHFHSLFEHSTDQT